MGKTRYVSNLGSDVTGEALGGTCVHVNEPSRESSSRPWGWHVLRIVSGTLGAAATGDEQ